MKLRLFVLVTAPLAMMTLALPAQTLTLLHNFTNAPDGASPAAGLLLAGGRLYGTTEKGGSSNAGSIFAVNTNGSGYTVLHSLTDDPDGSHPVAGLALAGGTLYGATGNGGTNGYGTVFSLNTNGDAFGYQVLYNFNPASNGVLPNARLTLAGGTIYGVASGDGYGIPGWGTVFSMSTNGSNYTPPLQFHVPSRFTAHQRGWRAAAVGAGLIRRNLHGINHHQCLRVVKSMDSPDDQHAGSQRQFYHYPHQRHQPGHAPTILHFANAVKQAGKQVVVQFELHFG
jgi:uncharacterized repeat protein (TIGR03803 family)